VTPALVVSDHEDGAFVALTACTEVNPDIVATTTRVFSVDTIVFAH
jgi:hypothetical protein